MRVVLVLGIVLVFGLGVGLYMLTRSDAVEATAAVSGSAAPRATEPATGEPAVTTPAVRSGKIDPQVLAPTTPRPTQPRGDSPNLEAAAPEPDAWIDPLPQAMRSVKNALRKQADAIDSYVSDCVAKSGTRSSGTAHLTVAFTRAADGKVKVTSVGVDSEIAPTFQDASLLRCLQETGRHMAPDIPDDYVTVTAKHQVDLENGNLVDHKLSAFDVWRPGDKEPIPH